MPTVQRAPAWRRVWPWLSVMAAVLLMLAALAGPALAHDGPSRLRDAVVSPRLARATTTIRFSVVYVDRSGATPIDVAVEIDGRPRSMVAQGLGRRDGRGLWFVASGRLPVGVHRIAFTARASDGSSLRLPAGLVRVVKGGPSGSGSGTTSGGTSSGTKPGAGSGSGGTNPAGDAAGTESGSASATGAAAGSGHPGGSDPSGGGSTDRGPAAPATPTGSGSAGGSGASGTSDGSGDAAPADASTASLKSPSNQASPADGSPVEPPGLRGERADAPPSAAEPAGPQPASSVDSAAGMGLPGVHPGAGPAGVPARDPDGGGTTAGGSGSRAAGAPDARDLLGAGGLPTELFRSTTILVTTGGSAVVWAAFVIFGRRRRDGDPPAPDPVLAAAAAAPFEAIETAELVPPSSGLPVPPGVDPTEAGLPRWRRPSLLQARKMDPLRTAVTAVSLTFDDGPATLGGMERRRIRYRLVTLMDVPDEVRANEIGILDQGDEVEIVDVHGTYRLVRCPDGQQGWLHQMVLGEVVGDGADDSAPDGIDEDVLAAFITTRQKSA